VGDTTRPVRIDPFPVAQNWQSLCVIERLAAREIGGVSWDEALVSRNKINK
jgi:hypothetical protein